MSLALNNVATTDEYPEIGPNASAGAQLIAGPFAMAEIDVYNAAVYVRFLISESGEAGQAVWQPELFLAPSHREIPRKFIYGVQFRSAVSGSPGQVTCELVRLGETWISVLTAAKA